MKPWRRPTSIALVLLAGAALAQEPVRVPVRTSEAEREMLELFGKVERTLDEIDRLLQEASSPPRAVANATDGLARKLQRAGERGRDVRDGIDRILELVRQLSPPCSSGSSGQQSQDQQASGQSPLDRQGEQSTGREPTPSTPEQGAKPEEQQGGKPKPDKQPGGKSQPESPQGSKEPPHQQPGGLPKVGQPGAEQRPVDEHDRWGDLPVHARDVFRSEGGRDMPPLYREWIDAYYRRLNKKP